MSTPTPSVPKQPELPIGLNVLEPDYISVPGQQYALVSFVGPEFCRQKSNRFAMKIRGVFATQEEAKAFVKRIQRAGDNVVDIFLMEMGQWAPCPPDPMSVETQEYQETFLNELMQGYAESQRSAKEVFADRKQKVMKEGLDAHLLPEERLPKPEAPLPTPEALPKLEKEVIEEVEEETAESIDASIAETVDKVFNDQDVWSSRHSA
jgi:hypothetical protein